MMITVEPAVEPAVAPAVKRSTEPAAAPVLPLAAALERRGLAGPALLYLAGHRPLAFVAGQFLALAAPLAATLGIDRTMDWARLLSTPEGVDHLQAALADRRSGLQPDMAGIRDDGNRRACSPTCEGGRAIQKSSSSHAACAAPHCSPRTQLVQFARRVRLVPHRAQAGRLLNSPDEEDAP